LFHNLQGHSNSTR